MESAGEKEIKWGIDNTHSEVQFKVKHLVISTVSGSFKEYNGRVVSQGEDFDGARAEFTIEVNSIDTNVPDRDAHLKSDDFFAADQYPQIRFENGVMKKVSGNNYILTGDLSIRDISRKVELNAESGGIATDPYGNIKAGFELSGKLSRRDFGLKWNQVTEAGGVIVGDEVKLLLNIQLSR